MPIRMLGRMPAVNSLIAETCAVIAYRIIEIDGGMITATAPDEVIRLTAKRSE
jgi:hypothetical protein